MTKCKFYSCCSGIKHDDINNCHKLMSKYYSFKNGFICQTCMTFEQVPYYTFYSIHSEHLTYFIKSKKSCFDEIAVPNCTTYSYCINSIHNNPSDCHLKMKNFYFIKDGFICPFCNLFETCSYDDFYSKHSSHLSNFTTPKKDLYLQFFPVQPMKIVSEKAPVCPTYSYCTNKIHQDPSSCHAVMKSYYSYKNSFICPSCKLIVDCDYQSFYFNHSNHLTSFMNMKKSDFEKKVHIFPFAKIKLMIR